MKNAIKIGVIGLGRAFTLFRPVLISDARIQIIGASDPRGAARDRFEAEFKAPAYASVDQLLLDDELECVYIASPHQLHKAHVEMAARAGKHILVEKPLAISLEECSEIVDIVDRYGVQLLVGPSHSYDAPILHARDLIKTGKYGKVRLIHTFNYTTFLYRLRRPEELLTSAGGGVVFSQGAHQIDIVRMLAGSPVTNICASIGNWDSQRPADGAYSALLGFADGAFASLTYSGYARYNSNECLNGVGEFGQGPGPVAYGAERKRILQIGDIQEEGRIKGQDNYGESQSRKLPTLERSHHPHFGPLVVSLEGADMQITPDGIRLYGNESIETVITPMHEPPRGEVVEELWQALRAGVPPVHDAKWGRATVEVCSGLLKSASNGCVETMYLQ